MPVSYASVLALAIDMSETKRMSLRELYAFFQNNGTLLPMLARPNWQHSVRHILSSQDGFVKVRSDGQPAEALEKNCFWKLDEEHLPQPSRVVLRIARRVRITAPASREAVVTFTTQIQNETSDLGSSDRLSPTGIDFLAHVFHPYPPGAPSRSAGRAGSGPRESLGSCSRQTSASSAAGSNDGSAAMHTPTGTGYALRASGSKNSEPRASPASHASTCGATAITSQQNRTSKVAASGAAASVTFPPRFAAGSTAAGGVALAATASLVQAASAPFSVALLGQVLARMAEMEVPPHAALLLLTQLPNVESLLVSEELSPEQLGVVRWVASLVQREADSLTAALAEQLRQIATTAAAGAASAALTTMTAQTAQLQQAAPDASALSSSGTAPATNHGPGNFHHVTPWGQGAGTDGSTDTSFFQMEAGEYTVGDDRMPAAKRPALGTAQYVAVTRSNAPVLASCGPIPTSWAAPTTQPLPGAAAAAAEFQLLQHLHSLQRQQQQQSSFQQADLGMTYPFPNNSSSSGSSSNGHTLGQQQQQQQQQQFTESAARQQQAGQAQQPEQSAYSRPSVSSGTSKQNVSATSAAAHLQAVFAHSNQGSASAAAAFAQPVSGSYQAYGPPLVWQQDMDQQAQLTPQATASMMAMAASSSDSLNQTQAMSLSSSAGCNPSNNFDLS